VSRRRAAEACTAGAFAVVISTARSRPRAAVTKESWTLRLGGLPSSGGTPRPWTNSRSSKWGELVVGADAAVALQDQESEALARHLAAGARVYLPAHPDHVVVALGGVGGTDDEALPAARRVGLQRFGLDADPAMLFRRRAEEGRVLSPEFGELGAAAVGVRLVPERHVAVHERCELAGSRRRRVAELVVGADAAVRAEDQHDEASRGHLAAAGWHHLPHELHDVLMEGDALARSEREALIPHPLLIGARHAGLDGLVAAGLQLAITGSAVGRPECDDHPLARVRIRLVPYRDVAIDECRELAHAVALLMTTFPNSVPCMKSWNAS